MLDAVLEDTCTPYSTRLGVLLRAEDDGFGAVLTIDFVDGFVYALHLVVALGVVVDKVGLYACIRTDTHHDDSGSLVVVALTEDALCASGGRLHYLLGGVRGRE